MAAWPYLVGSSNTVGDFVTLFLLTLAFAAAPIALAAIALWNLRPAWFQRGSWQLVLSATFVGATCGGLVGMMDTPASLQLVPVAAFSGAVGGIAGCTVLWLLNGPLEPPWISRRVLI